MTQEVTSQVFFPLPLSSTSLPHFSFRGGNWDKRGATGLAQVTQRAQKPTLTESCLNSRDFMCPVALTHGGCRSATALGGLPPPPGMDLRPPPASLLLLLEQNHGSPGATQAPGTRAGPIMCTWQVWEPAALLSGDFP